MRQWIATVLVCAAIGACGGSSSSNRGSGGAGGTGSGGTGGTGTGATGGLGGSGGGPPPTTTKLDLLFMVDNSISMGDKQDLLAKAVPRLIQQLTSPPVDPSTGKPRLQPVIDLHIGVITSSLGGHGGDQCAEGGPAFNPTQYDNAHLMPSVRSGLPSYQDLGFLWWDPQGTSGGETDLGKLTSDFGLHVTGAGESGCGYESQLEAWYRFLVDPSPPAKVVVSSNQVAEIVGVDDVVLKQRKDFLRPDSAVAILMLTDENDCSTIDGGFNWIAAQTSNPNNTPFHLARATSACASDPNSVCCRSCNLAESAPPPGCADLGSDPECAKGSWDDDGDHPNLRCWKQQQRFGLQFLNPTRKYVEALTQPTICPYFTNPGYELGECDKASGRVPNPLIVTRDPRLVFLVGVVGVPWQDLATDATLNDPNALELLSSDELAQKGRWDWLVPKCLSKVTAQLPRPMDICDKWDLADDPDDPFMIESNKPRSGTNPASGGAIAPESGGLLSSPINGHEWLTNEYDLEYACIFPLSTPKDCAQFTTLGCECDDVNTGYTANNPLCQDSSGSYTKLQNYAKAYPGTRHLQVMKDLGSQAVVASICAKSITDPQSTAYGYNAAMSALVTRLASVMPPK